MEDPSTHRSVSLIQADDAEEFALKLGEAVADSYAAGEQPEIAFSHTQVDGKLHFAAVVMGAGHRESEDAVTLRLKDDS